jgi:hypothetical protein
VTTSTLSVADGWRAGGAAGRSIAKYAAGVALTEQVRADQGDLSTPPAAPAAPSVNSLTPWPTAVIPAELVPFFQCIIRHESASSGVYAAVNPNGVWRGAYQMDQNFWRAYAPAEWKYLADSHNWETAPPEAQDAAALAGYRARGGQPWNGSGC